MDVRIEEVPSSAAGSLIKQFSVEVPSAEIMERLDKAIKELAPKVELKGFRKGHVPEKQIKERYGEELLRDILQEIVAETSKQALKDKGLDLALQPHAHLENEPKDLLAGADLKYKITIELQPQFELTDITQLALEKVVTEIKDEHITEALNDIAQRNLIFEEEEAARPSQNDDRVVIDIVGTVDGKPFQNNESKDMQVHLGKGQLQENLEKALLGRSAGESFNVPVGFPPDHPSKELAGKLADFSINLKSVCAQRPPVIDETFAKALGTKDVEELRQKVREEMKKADEATARSQMKQQISEKMLVHEFDLPPSLLQQEKEAMMRQIASMQQQLPPEEQKKAQAQMGKLEQNINEMAKKRVKTALVLSRIAKEKGLEVSQDELRQAIEADISTYGEDRAQIQKLYTEHPELSQRVYAQLLEEKTIDEIIKSAKITEKAVDRRELYQQNEKNNPNEGDDKHSLTDLTA
jgi:trigger factor